MLLAAADAESTDLLEVALQKRSSNAAAAADTKERGSPDAVAVIEVECRQHQGEQAAAAAVGASPFGQPSVQEQQQAEQQDSVGCSSPSSELATAASRAASKALAEELQSCEEWLRPWKVMASMATSELELLDDDIFAPVAFLEHPGSDTQVGRGRRGARRGGRSVP